MHVGALFVVGLFDYAGSETGEAHSEMLRAAARRSISMSLDAALRCFNANADASMSSVARAAGAVDRRGQTPESRRRPKLGLMGPMLRREQRRTPVARR